MQNSVTVTSRYFEERDLAIGEDDIVAVSCMRNERLRLPYFLEYYRRLGVDHFLLIDNNSTDGTDEFLRAQSDVSYFMTTASYRGSSAGRLWMQELADTYAVDRWVVTVDVDELLTFPAAEAMDLRDICTYMENNGHAGLFTVLLDMYSDLPLAKTVYEEGTNFLDACPFYETDTYRLAPGVNPPFLSVFGGPRGRMFEASGGTGNGPMMKKIPVVKWREGFSYMYSTHSHRFVQLSDVTGALLHFKFFDSFEELVARDAHRGDRRQQLDYRIYYDHTGGDLCFYGRQSHRYSAPRDLVQLGVMRASKQYATFCRQVFKERQPRLPDGSDLLPTPAAPEGSLSLRSVAALWPFVQNPGIGRHFGLQELSPRSRTAHMHDMQRQVMVIDVKGDHLKLRIDEAALHCWRSSGISIAVFVGERLASAVRLDGSDHALEIDEDSLEPNVCRLAVDIAGSAAIDCVGETAAPVQVYVFDGEGDDKVDPASSRPRAAVLRARGSEIFATNWYPEVVEADQGPGFNGVADHLDGGHLRGWIYDLDRMTFEVPITVYANGRLIAHTVPSKRRTDLDGLSRNPGASRGKGFLVKLPLGYFADNGTSSIRIEAFVAGTNIRLRRMPVVLPVDSPSAKWNAITQNWVSAANGSHGERDRSVVRNVIALKARATLGRRRSSGHASRPTK